MKSYHSARFIPVLPVPPVVGTVHASAKHSKSTAESYCPLFPPASLTNGLKNYCNPAYLKLKNSGTLFDVERAYARSDNNQSGAEIVIGGRCGNLAVQFIFIIMRQCCGDFSTGSLEKLKHAIMPDYFLVFLSAYHRAPFTLVVLLGCAVACGSASAQSSHVLQQAPQSDSKTSVSDTLPKQAGGGAYLGVYLGDVTADRATALGLKEIRGAVVGTVEEGSPAARVGLKEDDVILAINNRLVHNRAHFHRLLMDSQPGSKVTLGISRKGVAQNLEVVLGQSRSPALDARRKLTRTVDAVLMDAEEREKRAREAIKNGDEKAARELLEEAKLLRQEGQRLKEEIEELIDKGKIELPAQSSRGAFDLNANRYQIGVRVTPLTGQLAHFFNLSDAGVLITEVSVGELGETAGLKAGDCIVTVEGEPVKTASDLNRLVGQKSSGELAFVIMRDRSEQTIKIKLDQK